MFMQVAIEAIGIGIVLMIGYIVISQVQGALPSNTVIQEINPCAGQIIENSTPTGSCVITGGGWIENSTWTAPTVCGSANLSGANASGLVTCDNVGYGSGTAAVQVTVFAGFSLIAVGIIVLAAFALINVFR